MAGVNSRYLALQGWLDHGPYGWGLHFPANSIAQVFITSSLGPESLFSSPLKYHMILWPINANFDLKEALLLSGSMRCPFLKISGIYPSNSKTLHMQLC
jgi:hypothetical protein